MNLVSTTFYPYFLFSVFISLIKCHVLSVFWISRAIKNDPKIKGLRMPWKFYMIFSWIFKIFWCKNNQRGVHQVGTTHLGAPTPPGAPRGVVVPTWPPSLTSSYHIVTYLQEKIPIALSPCSYSFCCHFRSLCSKLHFWNCFGRLLLGMWLHDLSN